MLHEDDFLVLALPDGRFDPPVGYPTGGDLRMSHHHVCRPGTPTRATVRRQAAFRDRGAHGRPLALPWRSHQQTAEGRDGPPRRDRAGATR